MRIEAGVQFLFVKAPVYKGFPIPFNDNRLYGDSEIVTVEPVCIFCMYFLTKGLWGVHFEPRGVHFRIIPSLSFASNQERLISNNELQ